MAIKRISLLGRSEDKAQPVTVAPECTHVDDPSQLSGIKVHLFGNTPWAKQKVPGNSQLNRFVAERSKPSHLEFYNALRGRAYFVISDEAGVARFAFGTLECLGIHPRDYVGREFARISPTGDDAGKIAGIIASERGGELDPKPFVTKRRVFDPSTGKEMGFRFFRSTRLFIRDSRGRYRGKLAMLENCTGEVYAQREAGKAGELAAMARIAVVPAGEMTAAFEEVLEVGARTGDMRSALAKLGSGPAVNSLGEFLEHVDTACEGVPAMVQSGRDVGKLMFFAERAGLSGPIQALLLTDSLQEVLGQRNQTDLSFFSGNVVEGGAMLLPGYRGEEISGLDAVHIETHVPAGLPRVLSTQDRLGYVVKTCLSMAYENVLRRSQRENFGLDEGRITFNLARRGMDISLTLTDNGAELPPQFYDDTHGAVLQHCLRNQDTGMLGPERLGAVLCLDADMGEMHMRRGSRGNETTITLKTVESLELILRMD